MAQTGYTLPVFAVAAAKAALLHLLEQYDRPTGDTTHDRATGDTAQVELDLLPETVRIPIQQVASLSTQAALGITRSDPGDNLDLTRHTPIWAQVELSPKLEQTLILQAGEGLGRSLEGRPAIYSYAQRLFDANLVPLIPTGKSATVTIILPQGRQLAERTSNAAFGIVEGLSLLGTSGIAKPLSAEAHLDELRQTLRAKAAQTKQLVFCIGSNGMTVADRLGIPAAHIVQTGNWVGAMLVEAGLQGVESALVLGYQGKLIKLAGGIFNTSSHLADAKLEIMSAEVVRQGYDRTIAQTILNCPTADAAYKALVAAKLDRPIFAALAQRIRAKAMGYVRKYGDVELPIETVLFDRQGQIIAGTTPGTNAEDFRAWQ